jgi:hypothetical protein
MAKMQKVTDLSEITPQEPINNYEPKTADGVPEHYVYNAVKAIWQKKAVS